MLHVGGITDPPHAVLQAARGQIFFGSQALWTVANHDEANRNLRSDSGKNIDDVLDSFYLPEVRNVDQNRSISQCYPVYGMGSPLPKPNQIDKIGNHLNFSDRAKDPLGIALQRFRNSRDGAGVLDGEAHRGAVGRMLAY